MKLKLSELKPNPFKKQISKGKLNKEQVDKIKANIKELGFFGSLPVFKKDNKYYLIAGHHRVQALKEVYGKDHEVQVTISNYNEDQVFRGMVIENITQRTNDFMELNENIVAIENYINSKPEILKGLRDSRQPSKFSNINSFEKATSTDISFWIDKKTEEVISHDVITQNLNIYHKLDPELRQGVEKKHDKTSIERADDSLNYTQAVLLSGVDKKDQKPLAKVLKETREQRVREQGKLISQYKKAPEEVKEQIKKGTIDLADIETELIVYNQRNKKKNNLKVEDIDTKIKNLIYNFSFSVQDSKKELKGAIEDLLVLSRYSKDFKKIHKARLNTQLKILEEITEKVSKLISRIRENIKDE